MDPATSLPGGRPTVGAGAAAALSPPRLSRRLVAVFAVAVGASVANLYYVQPLLPALRRDLHVSAGLAALSTTLAQLGFVLGLLLVLPLGDLVERRRLIVVQCVACAASLFLAAVSPGIGALLAALFLVGLSTVVAQVLVPFAASLAPEHERGRVVGMVMSGLLVGILLARTAAGALASLTSWRGVFLVAAGIMTLLAAVLRVRLPSEQPRRDLSYRALLVSLVVIAREEPVLRQRAAFGAIGMGCFSALWTTVAFLLAGPPYHYRAGTIGLFGLVGAAGALMASAAGRLADRGRAAQVTVFTSACLAVSFVPIGLGAHSLWALLAGIVVLDVGVQGLHITNQSQIYRLAPEKRSRVNALYMIVYFLGGTAASGAAAALYAAAGWTGVAVLGGALGVAALALALAALRRSGSERLAPGAPG